MTRMNQKKRYTISFRLKRKDSRSPGELHRVREKLGELRDRRSPQKNSWGQRGKSKLFLDEQCALRGGDGIAADIEEIVMDADAILA